MSVELLSIVAFGGLLMLMFCGTPLGFAAGAIAVLAAYWQFGPPVVALALAQVYGLSTEYLLVAVPMFILLASLLERSTIAKELYDSLQRLTGRMTGGVAVVTLILSVILAAMSGIIGGEIVLLGLVALPQMLRLNYDRKLAVGTICAGGSLGTMMPPSIVLIVYGLTAEVSVQKLFIAAIVPALVLAACYFSYILIRCRLNPSLAPVAEAGDGPSLSLQQALRRLMPALLLIGFIMTMIYGGVTSITEAACMGVVGALALIILRGEFTLRLLNASLLQTFQTCGIILWVTFGASVLISVYNLAGGRDLITELLFSLDLPPLGVVAVMMLVFLILGMFMDWIGIVFLTMPIFVPIVIELGLDPIWFGILFCISMQVAFLSPPFGPAAFFLKSVAPPEITLPLIFRSLWPFALIQIAVLALVLLVPDVALWLPGS